ncbi:MAG TPA: formylglycine-generating enzyme family protein [Candidatus Wallbacteria bacterium]|nr:MAG: Serine/threonine-protein kinase pkn1 [bacterium ADurb.Bin243]HPG56672.1 formylglycine-generating enzyme family protein [Candidatus Wallbacteria bacterium]
MKNVLLAALFLMFVALPPSFASTGGDNLSIDLGDCVKLEMVKLPNGLYIGKYEVTQGQWKKIMGNNPSNTDAGDNFPVENISWNDIFNTDGFLEKINELKPSGHEGFRLPTETEWEYACRAGTQKKYYFGDDPSGELIGKNAWYAGNSGLRTQAVGQKKPNAFGLYDMAGNVSEWCAGDNDDRDGAARSTSAFEPPSRAARGGTCASEAKNCSSASRWVGNSDADRYSNVGFRLVFSGSGSQKRPAGNKNEAGK